jgi:hypothetical protein
MTLGVIWNFLHSSRIRQFVGVEAVTGRTEKREANQWTASRWLLKYFSSLRHTAECESYIRTIKSLPKSLTLKTANARLAETLENCQHSTRPDLESRNHISSPVRENLKTRIIAHCSAAPLSIGTRIPCGLMASSSPRPLNKPHQGKLLHNYSRIFSFVHFMPRSMYLPIVLAWIWWPISDQ